MLPPETSFFFAHTRPASWLPGKSSRNGADNSSMRGVETADGVWREVAGFRGPGLSEPSRPFDAFTKKKNGDRHGGGEGGWRETGSRK